MGAEYTAYNTIPNYKHLNKIEMKNRLEKGPPLKLETPALKETSATMTLPTALATNTPKTPALDQKDTTPSFSLTEEGPYPLVLARRTPHRRARDEFTLEQGKARS